MLQALDFWNDNIFIFMFVFLILIFTILLLSNQKQKIINYRKQISLTVALIQSAVWIASFSIYLSRSTWYRMLLTDLCPFLSFTSIPLFLADKDKIYKAIMPWLFIGATVTMLGGGAFIFSDPLQIPGFIEHSTMLCQGVFAYLWISKYEKKEYWLVLVPVSILIIWIMVIGFIPWQVTGDLRWVVFSTALFEPAIGPTKIINENGIIEGVGAYAILGDLGIHYPIPTLMFYAVAVLLSYIIVLNKNYFSLLLAKIRTKNKWKSKKITKRQ